MELDARLSSHGPNLSLRAAHVEDGADALRGKNRQIPTSCCCVNICIDGVREQHTAYPIGYCADAGEIAGLGTDDVARAGMETNIGQRVDPVTIDDGNVRDGVNNHS
ncbi:uncharacterized protein BKA55DRAFT_720413 [Fusarium redolens]|uniref:Uncharacterized protein n=1 Tax=Fusarium redolens TaxID=48865 RepID=A0A9P9FV22_FUSRE|nr:uncharacterized protein BKA55DRAFT_720413 [Fusarium redolens]KAH7208506.1 hypothetical protein BKA55DRAFT_720413 [Fusarium redolens]